MHTSVLISTLLGAGAFAFPQPKHAYLHDKKDVVFYSQWQEGPNTLVQEYVNENRVTGNPPVPTSTVAAVQVKADYAYPNGGQHTWQYGGGKKYQGPVAPTTTAAAPVITPAVEPSNPPQSTNIQASPVDSPPASSSPSAPQSSGSDGSTTTSGACNPTGGDAWSSPPCTGSSGASALDKINNLRTTWNSNLAKYEWSSALAQNAYNTAMLNTTWTDGVDSNGNKIETPNGEGRGWVMGHHLFPGSSGQCIAEGDNTKSNGNLTPIETMFLEWICEKPSAGIQDMCTATGNTNGDPNCSCPDLNKGCACGHALIIEDTSHNSIGCYFMNAVAAADKTDNAGDDPLRTKQELGTEGNSAPGMLTCDFAA